MESKLTRANPLDKLSELVRPTSIEPSPTISQEVNRPFMFQDLNSNVISVSPTAAFGSLVSSRLCSDPRTLELVSAWCPDPPDPPEPEPPVSNLVETSYSRLSDKLSQTKLFIAELRRSKVDKQA